MACKIPIVFAGTPEIEAWIRKKKEDGFNVSAILRRIVEDAIQREKEGRKDER